MDTGLILFAWLGNTDLRASLDSSSAELGPILTALQGVAFDRLVLLSDHPQEKTRQYIDWQQSRAQIAVDICHVQLTSPTSFEEIYLFANQVVANCREKYPLNRLSFHLSPGTPAMAAIWMLLAKAKYGAELIETSKEHGVRSVSIPFELSVEYSPTPSRESDEALARLVRGLPPAVPEFSSIVHQCMPMKRVVAMAHRLAQRDVSVLIQGESGTGKELFARAIHGASTRKSGRFVAVNCGAIPADLIDSELFGHEKGAFTGAHVGRSGYFEEADGGTLFLDEIGELPLLSQVRLLRVLQEREITRLGATLPKKIDVRVIAATNRILPEDIRSGHFREDVFHRIAVGVLVLPPLREREGDLSLLIDKLMEQINMEAQSQPGYINKKISVAARNLLIRYSWPGNIRELHNVLVRASIWADGDEVAMEDVSQALAVTRGAVHDTTLGKPLVPGFSLPDLMADVACHYLDRALEESQGNKTEVARMLGLGSYQTVTNWLEKYHTNKHGMGLAIGKKKYQKR